jgi:hypothetical protein
MGWSSATPNSDLAVGLLQAGRKQLQEPTVRAASGGSLSPLGWACMDAGRWDDALEAAAEVDDFSTATRWTLSGRPRVAPWYGGQPAAATPRTRPRTRWRPDDAGRLPGS